MRQAPSIDVLPYMLATAYNPHMQSFELMLQVGGFATDEAAKAFGEEIVRLLREGRYVRKGGDA